MFSLRMLLAVVALAAVYVAGMLFRTPWWEASILTLTYMIFAGSIAAAILSREHRAFFVTFAAFGLAYCASVYFRMELVTTRALHEFASRVQEEANARDDVQCAPTAQDFVTIYPAIDPANPPAYLPTAVPPPPPAYLRPQVARQQSLLDESILSSFVLKSIGQAFFAVLFGLVTGVVAEAIMKRKTSVT